MLMLLAALICATESPEPDAAPPGYREVKAFKGKADGKPVTVRLFVPKDVKVTQDGDEHFDVWGKSAVVKGAVEMPFLVVTGAGRTATPKRLKAKEYKSSGDEEEKISFVVPGGKTITVKVWLNE